MKWSNETWWVLFYLQLLSDAEQTPLGSLKDRHIHHPKHKVYETDVLNLTEKVEGYVSIGGVLSRWVWGTWGEQRLCVFFFVYSGWRSECMILTSLCGSLIKLCGKNWVVIQRKRCVEVCCFHFCQIYTARGNGTNSLQHVCCRSSNLSVPNLKRGTTSSEKQAEFGLMRWKRSCTRLSCRLIGCEQSGNAQIWVASVASYGKSLTPWFCFQAEQQSLMATIEKADEMISSLDGCICELEAGMSENLASTTPTLLHFCGSLSHAWTDTHTRGDMFGMEVCWSSQRWKWNACFLFRTCSSCRKRFWRLTKP